MRMRNKKKASAGAASVLLWEPPGSRFVPEVTSGSARFRPATLGRWRCGCPRGDGQRGGLGRSLGSGRCGWARSLAPVFRVCGCAERERGGLHAGAAGASDMAGFAVRWHAAAGMPSSCGGLGDRNPSLHVRCRGCLAGKPRDDLYLYEL